MESDRESVSKSPVFQINGQALQLKHVPEAWGYHQKEKSRFHLLHKWTLCAYYALFVPFKPVADRNGSYSLHSNKFQKILCFGMWSLVCLYFVTDIIHHFKYILESSTVKVGECFKFFWNIARIIKQIIFYCVIVGKRGELKSLLKTIGDGPLIKSTTVQKKSIWHKLVIVYIVILLIGKSCLTVLSFTFYGRFIGHYVEPSSKFQSAIVYGRFRLIFGSKNYIPNYTALDICFGTIEIALQLAFFWNEYFLLTFCSGILGVTFYMAAKALQTFVNEISTKRKSAIDSLAMQRLILEKYLALKSLTDCINKLWSGMIFFWLMERTLIIIFIDFAVSSKDILLIVTYIVETLFAVVSLILMADGYRMCDDFTDWLMSRNVLETYFHDKREWKRLVRELHAKPIGIGFKGIYKIRYGLLAQYMGFAVTLFTIGFEKKD